MGRNRKGRQCGGYASKKERFVLHKRWQQEAAKCAARNKMARQAQYRLAEKEKERKRLEANRALGRVRPRLDVLTAWTNARLKDDQMERLKQRGVTAIASELEKTTATTVQSFSSLQERCIYEIARTFDLFSATCPFTREFFSIFEPWMISRLSELTTAFKTMNDGNVSLLLQQSTNQLTLGFVRHEKSLAGLFDQGEVDRQRMTWQLNGPLPQYEAESWEELDVDEVEIVESHEEARLESLCLISCTGLSLPFVMRLGTEHPFIENLKVIDCFDVASGDNGAQLLLQLARWRNLKTLHFSWCCWLTTELLVTFAYQLLEPPRSLLQELHVSDCFDVLEDYPKEKRKPSKTRQGKASFLGGDMELSGPLYRRTPRLFSPNKPGDWSLVWCELVLEEGELVVSLDRDGSSRLATIRIKDCDLAHVRSDGRDCFEITVSKAKKETFSSHESSHDVDWWMSMLVSLKRDLELGIKPRVPIVCMPASGSSSSYKSSRRLHSTSLGTAEAMNRLSDPTHSPGSPADSQRAFRRRQPSLVTSMALLERFTIYETPTTYYVVCSDRHYSRFRLLELNRVIERPTRLSQVLNEDTEVYSWEDMEAKLQHIAETTRASGTGLLTRAFTAVAMVGCIRFLRGYYFTFVTQRRKIGFIGGNSIYGISATQQLHVSLPEKDNVAIAWINRWLNPSAEEEAEKRYLGLFHFLDLTKDFFFSYSYDITHTLQHNMTTEHSEPSEMFTWNSYLTRELKTCLSGGAVKDLVIPLVLGCYEQRKCSIFGRLVSVILLARRSRHFAGTRYLKRGVADTGMVANDVELEQIIEDENMGPGKFSSFVQHRGSIPVFWSQETSPTLPKPPIVLNRVDPTYSSTQKHFADLFARYGSPIVALNLVKQNEKKEREVIVGNEYMNAVEYINNFMPAEHRVRYVALDYSRLSGPKQKGVNVLHSLDKVAVWALGQTGVFCSAPKRRMNLSSGKQSVGSLSSPYRSVGPASSHPNFGDLDAVDEISAEQPPPSTAISKHSGEWLEQRGVLRTNCIDCLDRTNVSQFSVGMRALGQQLYVMGIRNTPLLESRSQLVMVLMKLYSLVGDAISMQYGGSEAHKNVKNSAARENVKHRELLTSIRRYYSNSFTDTAKQDAINIFLGHFVPKEGEPPLWELESDYYLHNFEVLNGKMAVEKVRKYLEFHAESKKRVFGEDYGVPMQLACCAPQQTTEDEDEDEFIDDEFEYYREVILRRDRDKRDEYIHECRRVMEEWWKEPIESFDRQKCVPPASGVVNGTKVKSPDVEAKPGACCAMNSSLTPGARSGLKGLGPLYSDEFLHMYHPDEITTFEKVLGYKFMNPIELSDESESAAKRRTDSAVVAHLTSAPSSSSIVTLAPVDEENLSELDPPSVRRPVAKVPTRSYRSMSAPDFCEELERADSVRKGRDSSHEFKVSESEEFLSISGVDSRHTNRAALAANNGNGRHHGGSALKTSGLRKDDPISIERYAQSKSHKKFIGDCTSAPPDPIYDRYVHMKESPQMWENDNEGAKMYFEAYLRENNISPDDARGLREAQSRGGATFKIQTGPYTGLDQNIKARVLVAKKLKTDSEDRKIFEDSLDYNKLVQTTTKSFPAESLELYKSFFADDLPEVKLYGEKKEANKSRFSTPEAMPSSPTSGKIADVLKTLTVQPTNRKSGGRLRDSELIPVGPLFKMDGGKDRDYILFNAAAADQAFGEVLRNETALSFYSK